MNNIFMELKEKIEKIDFSGLILYNENKDGRLNSAIAEGQVFDFLKHP